MHVERDREVDAVEDCPYTIVERTDKKEALVIYGH
jgi:hypothetical protein